MTVAAFAGTLGFEPDDMRAAARRLDAARAAVADVSRRVGSTPLPPMPAPLAAHVVAELGAIERSLRDDAGGVERLAHELRFRAFLADVADAAGGGRAPGADAPGGGLLPDLAAWLLAGVGQGLNWFVDLWQRSTLVRGHARRLANGTTTWVRSHWRTLGHDIARHARVVRGLKIGGWALTLVDAVDNAVGIFRAFQAPAADRPEAVGGATGKLAGGIGGAVGGAKVGALGGAAIGTMIAPGIGTAIGGVAGAVIGGAAGAWAGSSVGQFVGENIGQPLADAGGAVVGGVKKAASALNPFD